MRFVSGIRSFIAPLIVAAPFVVSPGLAAQETQERSAPAASPFSTALQVPPGASVLPSAQRPAIVLPEPPAAERPKALIPLYASLAVLQGLDVHSTRRGLSSGGREANPMMDPVVKNGAAFIAVKAATTAGVIFASERLWKVKNRKASVLLTVITNAGLAAVVAHNYRVAR